VGEQPAERGEPGGDGGGGPVHAELGEGQAAVGGTEAGRKGQVAAPARHAGHSVAGVGTAGAYRTRRGAGKVSRPRIGRAGGHPRSGSVSDRRSVTLRALTLPARPGDRFTSQ